MLSPLGIYDLSDGSISGSELAASGAALDQRGAAVERTERESCSVTAEEEGLSRRAAIAALLQIGGDSFSLDAINQTISGCGIR